MRPHLFFPPLVAYNKTMEKKDRLFIAVCFPDRILDALTAEAAPLRRACSRSSFSRRENLHLTLVFLGETDRTRIPEITAAMDSAAGPSFSLRIGRFGRFRDRQGDTLWREIDGDEELFLLQRRLEEALRQRGFSPEQRPYRPHLTISRRTVLQPGITLAALSAETSVLRTDVREIVLLRSQVQEGRRVYTPVHRTALSAPQRPVSP